MNFQILAENGRRFLIRSVRVLFSLSTPKDFRFMSGSRVNKCAAIRFVLAEILLLIQNDFVRGMVRLVRSRLRENGRPTWWLLRS